MGINSSCKLWFRPLSIGLLALLAIGILYFYKLGSFPLLDPDEPVYGQVAREMALGHGWLSPHFLGELWFDKPPLFYWLTGFTSTLLGATELAARLPSSLLAVGLLMLVYALAAYDFGKHAGLLSAVVMATCLQQIVLAHAAVTDMTLVFCLTAALYAFRRWVDADGHSAYGWAILCGAMTGLGMLAKGPVAPFLIVATICIYLGWSRKFPRLKRHSALLALGTTLLVGLPWFIAMFVLHQDDFVQGFLVANNIARFTTAEHANTSKWYSIFNNFPILLAFLFPWSVFLPQAIARRFWRINDGAKLALAYCIVVFVFFSISKTILVTYIFPLFPAASLLIGAFWRAAASEGDRAIRGLRGGLVTGVVLAAAIMLFLVQQAKKDYPAAVSAAWALGGILLIFMLVALIYSYRCRQGKVDNAAFIISGGMVCFTFWLMYGILPFVGPVESKRGLVDHLPAASGARIIAFQYPPNKFPSLYYYGNAKPGYRVTYIGPKVLRLGEKPIAKNGEDVQEIKEIARYLNEPKPTFIVSKRTKTFNSLLGLPNALHWGDFGDCSVITNITWAAFSEKGSQVQ